MHVGRCALLGDGHVWLGGTWMAGGSTVHPAIPCKVKKIFYDR